MSEQTYRVDVIICIHNALSDVQACLGSVQSHTHSPYQLILVDDGSDDETCDYLQDYAQQHPCVLLRNEQAGGYTLAANQGLHAASSQAVVLLNSDTIVTPNWLARLQTCAEQEEKIGMVGPLSNTASWQSIPKIEYQGDWATNPLPDGFSIEQMGKLVECYSARLYPRLPFLNGFCLYIKRSLIDDIGYFDELHFAQGYGEENDYSLRAGKAGWQLLVCDSVYVYHAQSKSYSHERRKKLADQAGGILAEKHGQALINQCVELCRHSRVMAGIRRRSQFFLARHHLGQQAQYRWQQKRILFVLPVREAGGGGHVVISEAQALRRMGMVISLLNLAVNREVFEACHPHLDLPVIYAAHEGDIVPHCIGFDAVIATANHSVAWLHDLHQHPNPPRIAYYIQDFEPWFFIEKLTSKAFFWRYAWLRRRLASWYFRRHDGFRQAWLSYLQTGLRLTKTTWNQQEIQYQTGQTAQVVGISFDYQRFLAKQDRYAQTSDSLIHISAMIRPSSQRRAPSHSLNILKKIKDHYADRVRISIFGALDDDPLYQQLPRDFEFIHLGLCHADQVADLFNGCDIFVDFSYFQAMGLTALEAMACGVAVIVPENGGTDSFARHQHNALIVDSFDEQVCYQALDDLINQTELREALAQQAAWDVAAHYPERSAYVLLEKLFD